MAAAAGLEVAYVPLGEIDASPWGEVLGVANFDRAPPSSPLARDIPMATIRTPVLGAGDGVREIWRTHQHLASGARGAIRYRCSESLLFGCISIVESDFGAHSTNSDGSPLHAATEHAYREIFATLDELDYPHLARVWNYLAQINVDTHGIERYRQFNSARRAVLTSTGRDLSGNVPAACALGSVSGSPLEIYFLASREAPLAIENPRQVSAYDYPPQYGPRPVFARGSLLKDRSGDILFISGTASIVGHRTVHPGDVAAQTRESLANIEALLAEANRAAGGERFDLGRLAYKVYVRDRADLPVIRAQLQTALGSRAQLIYLQADICRQDLLVEIEAVGKGAAAIAA